MPTRNDRPYLFSEITEPQTANMNSKAFQKLKELMVAF